MDLSAEVSLKVSESAADITQPVIFAAALVAPVALAHDHSGGQVKDVAGGQLHQFRRVAIVFLVKLGDGRIDPVSAPAGEVKGGDIPAPDQGQRGNDSHQEDESRAGKAAPAAQGERQQAAGHHAQQEMHKGQVILETPGVGRRPDAVPEDRVGAGANQDGHQGEAGGGEQTEEGRSYE